MRVGDWLASLLFNFLSFSLPSTGKEKNIIKQIPIDIIRVYLADKKREREKERPDLSGLFTEPMMGGGGGVCVCVTAQK